jgi:phage terminase large subunit
LNAEVIPFNWKAPDYLPVYRERVERLKRLRANPAALPALKLFYRDNPAIFINDWGCLYEPRNVERNLPTVIPFLLFPRQVELIRWIMERWKKSEPGVMEKSRDVGASWIAMALSGTLCLFYEGITIGIGSRKEDLLDNQQDPSSLMFKARMFLKYLPPEFLGDFNVEKHSAHLRLTFPGTGSAIVCEAGDQIGRGARTSLFCVDEAAYLERDQLIEASLSATTNCRIDMSSVNGLTNAFARKRHSGKISVFSFRWQQDPRKDQDWYQRQCELLPPHVIASELDLDYRGSMEGQLLPSAWVNSAIGAAQKLGIEPTGAKYCSLDCADEGADDNAFAMRHGIELQYLKSWSGKGLDIYRTVVKAFALCDIWEAQSLVYDSDGLGSGVRGDANVINIEREAANKSPIRVTAFRGSGSVPQPDRETVKGRKNKDFFLNAKSSAWWHLRMKFEQTHRAIVDKMPVDPEAIISISPNLEELLPLLAELSQIQYGINATGKIQIEKQPNGTVSPNRADAMCLVFSGRRGLELWERLGRDEDA